VTDWRWIDETVLLAIHDEQLAEHGGRSGVRDIGLLQSALARPRHRQAYAETDAAGLAAAYAFCILRNHPFIDGNKRAALVAAELFLLDNGFELVAGDPETLDAVMRLAEGAIGEEDFAAWLRRNIEPRG
jgi:death-on-curing protein